MKERTTYGIYGDPEGDVAGQIKPFGGGDTRFYTRDPYGGDIYGDLGAFDPIPKQEIVERTEA